MLFLLLWGAGVNAWAFDPFDPDSWGFSWSGSYDPSKDPQFSEEQKYNKAQDYYINVQQAKAQGGCLDTDGGGALTSKGYPLEAQYDKAGSVYHVFSYEEFEKDPATGQMKKKKNPKELVDTQTDECVTSYITGKTNLREYFCDKNSVGEVIINQVTLPCRTGTTCVNGACVVSGNFSCPGAKVPFLDSNGNGETDACACPEDYYPSDSNQDGNSDACNTRQDLCSLKPEQIQKLGFVIKGDTKEEGVKQYLDICIDNKTLKHVICSLEDVKATSTTKCLSGQVCQNGNCVDQNSLCDDSKQRESNYEYGWVTLYEKKNGQKKITDQPADKCADKCKDFAEGSQEKVACLNNPNVVDQVSNAICGGEGNNLWYYDTKPCAINPATAKPVEKCQDGICIPIPGAGPVGGGPGGSNGTPADPNKEDPKNPPCTPKTSTVCTEPADDKHPVDSVFGQLWGEPEVFGKTKITVTSEVCPTGLPKKIVESELDDSCEWIDTDIDTQITQYGCSKESLKTSITPCGWKEKGLACDWQAKKSGEPGFGACVKPPKKASVSVVKDAKGKETGVVGTNAFGRKVDHKNYCISSDQLYKWVLADNAEGAIRYEQFCPNNGQCVDGACVPNPCVNANPDDLNPCTVDTATADFKNNTCVLDNYPWEGIDDGNACTVDSCTPDPADKTKAKVIHAPVKDGNCSGWYYCKANPDKCKAPDCQNDPKNAACPPPGGLNCDDPANYGPDGEVPKNCEETINYCQDTDPANKLEVKGQAVFFPGKANMKMATDACTNPIKVKKKVKGADGKEVEQEVLQYTSVRQVSCGMNLKFYFPEMPCVPGQVCVDGACVKP